MVYWETTRFLLVDRRIIVNFVLSSTLWYFITLWASSLKIIRLIRVNLCNFLWSGSTSRAWSRVCWNDVCAPKKIGWLNIIDLEEALNALMVKWIIKALNPRDLNL